MITEMSIKDDDVNLKLTAKKAGKKDDLLTVVSGTIQGCEVTTSISGKSSPGVAMLTLIERFYHLG